MIDCLSIEKDLGIWCDVLRDCKVDDVPSRVGEPWFRRCGWCRKGKKSPKSCQGASIAIERGQRIRFPPTGGGLVPELAVKTKRCGPGIGDIKEHSVEIYVRAIGVDASKTLVHFSRVDLGRGTAEPRYHIQFGGCSDDTLSFHPKADCLRWPGPLYDFVLASELILYTFYSATWREKILRRNEALGLVRQSEQNYLKLWMDAWRNYSDNVPSGQTFLAVACTSNKG